jgi:hypothetical protein
LLVGTVLFRDYRKSMEEPKMKMAEKINVQELEKIATNSQHKETFMVTERTSTCRIGVGARLDIEGSLSVFLEILINVLKENDAADLEHLEKSLMLLKELKTRKYPLNSEDGNSVSCEIMIPQQNLGEELQIIHSTIKKIYHDNSTQ